MSRKSKKIALKTIRQYCQNELTRKAMAYAREATAIMQASTTTNAGSSRAHWFLVSARRAGFDQEEAAARTAGMGRARLCSFVVRYLRGADGACAIGQRAARSLCGAARRRAAGTHTRAGATQR